MKVAFNKNIVKGPYGGGNIVLAQIVKYLQKQGVEVCFNLDKTVDVAVIMDAREKTCFTFADIFKHKQRGLKVVHRINDNGRHRENDSKRDLSIIKMDKELADKTVFISKWLQNYFEDKGLKREDAIVIHNGADRNLFKPIDRNRLKDDSVKIITHHWSRNMAKGYSVYEELSDFCAENSGVASFSFLGRCPDNCMNRAKRYGAKPYSEIPGFLQGNDVYITASRYESGGCHIVEGMACGLIPVVQRGGGGTEEYAGEYGLFFDNTTELEGILSELRYNWDFFISRKRKMMLYEYSMEEMCKKYFKTIKLVMT